MEIIKFMYEQFWTTFCLIMTLAVAISGIILAFKGKRFWD